MTFLKSSDVKNHLYTGSGPKHNLISEEADLVPENKTSPDPAMSEVVPEAVRPATAIGASVPDELAIQRRN